MNDNRDYTNYAFILKTEEILQFTELVSVSDLESRPEYFTPEHLTKKGTYLGRGYRYNHDYLGHLSGGSELCDFWKR